MFINLWEAEIVIVINVQFISQGYPLLQYDPFGQVRTKQSDFDPDE